MKEGGVKMYIKNEYYCWKVAHELISRHGFELLQIDERNQEIWLKGKVDKRNKIVRLYNRGFDWANHLKKDLAFVIERIRKIQKMVKGKEIDILNVYFSQYQPVDDWDSLKKPITLKDRKTIITKTYYIDEDSRYIELERLFHDLGFSKPLIDVPSSEELLSIEIRHIKHQIITQQQAKRNEIASTFNYGKPIFTYLLLIINVILFFLVENSGGSTNTFHLIEWGAKFNPYIMEGEWWRIVSSMFLHIGYLHIIMNMLALYYLGVTVEKMYGSMKFLLIYMLGGIIGGLTSFAFNTSVAAGASGAIFGLFGALLFFGVMNRKLFFQTMGSNLLFIIGLNILLGLNVPSIDMEAHLGGLVGGFVASGIVQMPKKKLIFARLLSFLLFVCITIGLIFYGIEQNQTKIDPNIEHILALNDLEEKEYEQAIERFTIAINHSKEKDEQLYFNRSIAYYYLEQWEEAKSDLIQAVTINDKLAEGHYNLALVYLELFEYDQAYAHAEKAAKLRPNNDQFQTLLGKLQSIN
jgi:rhomboid protease GluP